MHKQVNGANEEFKTKINPYLLPQQPLKYEKINFSSETILTNNRDQQRERR